MINKLLVTGIVTLSVLAATVPAKADMGATVGVGVVMGIVGYMAGKLLSDRPDPPMHLKYRYQGSDPVQLCMNQYKSYDTRTGMITLQNGTKKRCPYLQ